MDDAVTEDDAVAEGDAVAPKKRQRSFWAELPILLLVALVLSFLIQTFVARVYVIPSGSMEPTLQGSAGSSDNDRIVVDKITYRFGDPRPGDVVVFKGPPSWEAEFSALRSDNPLVRGLQQVGSVVGLAPPDEDDFVKRVIATGGQTVECCDEQGRVLVDGVALNEPYVKFDFPFDASQTCETPTRSGRCFDPVVVPEGNLWVMGDARNNSADSRAHVGDELRGTVPVENVIGKTRLIVLPVSRWQTVDSPQIAQAQAQARGEVPGPAPVVLGALALWPLRRLSGAARAAVSGSHGR